MSGTLCGIALKLQTIMSSSSAVNPTHTAKISPHIVHFVCFCPCQRRSNKVDTKSSFTIQKQRNFLFCLAVSKLINLLFVDSDDRLLTFWKLNECHLFCTSNIQALCAHSWRQPYYCNLAVVRNLECWYLFKAGRNVIVAATLSCLQDCPHSLKVPYIELRNC
jgi:hypothetical protein